MNVNEIWCSICCRFMDEGCRKCNHFDEQLHLPDADKGTGMITGEDPEDMKEGVEG